MPGPPPPSTPGAPQPLDGERHQDALDAAGLGTVRWEIRSGALDYDENFARLLDAAPEGLAAFVRAACVEITRRKSAEETARQGSERLQLALAAGQLGDWEWNAADDVVTLSERAAEIFGLPPGQPITWTRLRDMLHEEYRERARLAVEESIATRTDYSIEYRVHKPSGEDSWIAARGRGTYTASGEVLGMIGVVQDITARVVSEGETRRREQFNRTIVESSRDCIKTLALDGTLTWISSTGCRALGVADASELVGESYLDFWAGEERAAASRAIEAAAHGGTGTFVGATVSAPSRAWNVMITPILGSTGEPASLLVVSRDVTERVEMERALREETRILEVLHKTGATLTAQLDLRSVLQLVTDAATELCGAKFGAFFYNMCDDNGEAYQLVTLSGAPREAFERLGHPRATPVFAPTFRGEAAIRLDDVLADPRYGNWAPHHGTPPGHLPVRSYLAVPVIARGGEVLGGLFFGHPEVGVFNAKSERLIEAISAQASIAIDNARLYEASQKASEERRKLLESERYARTQAERMSAMKDEFLAVLSHELRTPLSAILGWSQVLRQRTTDNPDLAKGLEIIERNARAQTQLIEDLLDMSRIVSGKMRLEVQSILPDAFVEAAIEAVRPGATAKGIRLEVLLDAGAGPISGDPARLQQVMWNLLSNAIKFTQRGGRVQVLLERVHSHVEISVADTGAGISPDFLAHVFERFRQADASTTRKYGGLGLGLSIVKHLVELHGGTVQAVSPGEGRGSTFTVKLPLLLAYRVDGEIRLHPSAETASASAFKPLNLNDVKVVIVDDEPDARLLAARVLEECGASVFTASSATEALALIERECPHVLVTDIGMPEVDGFALLRQVRALDDARGRRVPAVALTAFARSEDRTRALSAGFVMHLSKPVEPSELVATIASAAGRTP